MPSYTRSTDDTPLGGIDYFIDSSQFRVVPFDFALPGVETITLVVRTISGTGTITPWFRLKEEF